MKKTARQILFVVIQFIIINTSLAIISSLIIIITRDVELIRVTNIDEKEYSPIWLLRYMWIGLAFVSFIIVNFINIKKLYAANKIVFSF
jgi:hypothetical protein